jgi:hypothetical protein
VTPTACHLGTLLLMSRPSSVFPVAPVTVDPRLLHLEIRLRLAKVRSDDSALIHQLKADIRRIEHLGDRQRGGAPKKLKTPCLLENRPSKPTPHGHVHNKVKVVKEQPEGEEAQGRMNELTSFCSKNVCSLRGTAIIFVTTGLLASFVMISTSDRTSASAKTGRIVLGLTFFILVIALTLAFFRVVVWCIEDSQVHPCSCVRARKGINVGNSRLDAAVKASAAAIAGRSLYGNRGWQAAESKRAGRSAPVLVMPKFDDGHAKGATPH